MKRGSGKIRKKACTWCESMAGEKAKKEGVEEGRLRSTQKG
jgi:hypothetical protein